MILRETLINEDDVSNNDEEESKRKQGGQSNNNNDDDWEIEIGRWQITDWDDLLDGNVFFT